MRVNESINRVFWLKSLSIVFVLVVMSVTLVMSPKTDAQSLPLFDIIAINNAGTEYAVAFDNVIEIRDLYTHNLINTLIAHTAKITAIEWSPDDSMLATGSYDESLIVWNSSLGTQIHVFDDYSAYIISILWYPDNDMLIGVSGPEEYRFSVRKILNGQLVHKSTQGVASDIILDPANDTVSIAVGPDIHFMDPNTYEKIGRLRTPNAGLVSYFQLAYHPNGNVIAAGRAEGNVDVWDTQSSTILHELMVSESSLDAPLNQIRVLSFTPDGRYLSSISGDGIVKVFDWVTATVVSETQLNSVITGADFASDGLTLVYATKEGLTATINAIADDVLLYDLTFTPEATEEP